LRYYGWCGEKIFSDDNGRGDLTIAVPESARSNRRDWWWWLRW
jgi:hypothetical protein